MLAVLLDLLRSHISGGLMSHLRFFYSIMIIVISSKQGDLVTVHPINERDPVPLAVHHHPVTTTFAMFQVCLPPSFLSKVSDTFVPIIIFRWLEALRH